MTRHDHKMRAVVITVHEDSAGDFESAIMSVHGLTPWETLEVLTNALEQLRDDMAEQRRRLN